MSRIHHLLLIEDNESERTRFTRAFALSGLQAQLHCVGGAADALLFLKNIGLYATAPRPKIIVLNLNLPHMDGRKLLETLSSNPRFTGIPVVVLTGHDHPADRIACRELRVQAYWTRPQTAAELVEMLSSLDHWLIGSATGIPT